MGTSIRVLLPLTDEPIREEAQHVEAEEPRGGDETILVAEDDACVSLLVVRALEARGYRILVAHDGRMRRSASTSVMPITSRSSSPT